MNTSFKVGFSCAVIMTLKVSVAAAELYPPSVTWHIEDRSAAVSNPMLVESPVSWAASRTLESDGWYRFAQNGQMVEETASTKNGSDDENGSWVADKNGCLVWSNSKQKPGTPIWSGNCVEGKAQGEGVLNWVFQLGGEISSTTFVGYLAAGRRQGRGTFTDEDSRTTEGMWLDDEMFMVLDPEQQITAQTQDGSILVENVSSPVEEQDILEVQRALSKHGYYYGEISGLLDDETSLAISIYNMEWGFPVSDTITNELIDRLNGDAPETRQQFLDTDKTDCRVLLSPEPNFKITWTGGCKNKKASGSGMLSMTFTHRMKEKTSKFQGSITEGVFQGVGKITFPDGSTYKGEFRDGIRHGKGILTSVNGDRYEGDFQDGLQHGSGVFTSPDGTRYEGEFQNGQREGTGVLVGPNGIKFTGTFKAGLRTGIGTMMWPGGNRYVGSFVESRRTGKGEFFWSNGDYYKGDFIKGERTGKGISTWANGGRYQGEYLEGRFHGKGEYTWDNGNSYSGDFSNGERTGSGVFTWADGRRFEGDFVNGARTGVGTITWPDGNTYQGDFANGEMSGKGVFTWANGNQYDGDFEDNSRHGKGKFSWPNGDYYQGDYFYGEATGKGAYIWANGGSYTGGFLKGNFHGLGTKIASDGERITGVWRDDNRIEGLPEDPITNIPEQDQTILVSSGTDAPFAASKEQIELVQKRLNNRYYNAGPIDGVMGPKTANAIKQFRSDWQMPDSSEISEHLIKMLRRATVKTQFRSIETDRPDCHIRYWPEPQHRATWTGSCNNGLANGQGKLVFSYLHRGHIVHETYDGEMMEGRFHGFGAYTAPNGFWYEGEYREGRRHGEGSIHYQNGNRYSGDFRDGLESGFGLTTWSDGSQYQGEHEGGRIEGFGEFQKPDGFRITGTFEGKFGNGTGMIRYSTGTRYYGKFENFRPNGKGLLVPYEGTRKEGTFRNSKLIKSYDTGIIPETPISGHGNLSKNLLVGKSVAVVVRDRYKLCARQYDSCEWTDGPYKEVYFYIENSQIKEYQPMDEDGTSFTKVSEAPLDEWVEYESDLFTHWSIRGKNLIYEMRLPGSKGLIRSNYSLRRDKCQYFFEQEAEILYTKLVEAECYFNLEDGNSFE